MTDSIIESYAKEVRDAAQELGPDGAQLLVNLYYDVQGIRIMSNNRAKATERDDGDPRLMQHFTEQFKKLETQTAHLLRHYANSQYMGQWAMNIHGIGPVLAAALLSTIQGLAADATSRFALCSNMPATSQKGRE